MGSPKAEARATHERRSPNATDTHTHGVHTYNRQGTTGRADDATARDTHAHPSRPPLPPPRAP